MRYSRILYGGTARFQGLGGAFGAVGADFSAIATNPAGLGLYSSSEFTFSPLLRMSNTLSNYNGETNRDNRFNAGMGDLGLVFNIKPKNSTSLRNFNFAFGMNRQNNFSNRVVIEGVNNKSSLLTQYVGILNNDYLTPNDINDRYGFDISLAYNTDLIFLKDSANRIYANDAPNGGVIQRKTIRTSGSINEFDFAFGANLNDRFYFGVTIGIPVIRYYETSNYEEFKNDTSVHYFQSMRYNQELQTQGSGLNLKLGIIYRPADWVRIGAAVHTPTYYGNMRDNWNSSMDAEFDYSITNSSSSPLGTYDYELTTPFRAIGSVAFIIGKIGLISGEYEYVDYSQSEFSADDDFSDINREIQHKYGSPVNFRFGTEWRIQNFLVRGGAGYYGSPYKNSINTGEIYTGSLGLGYRAKHFFFDLAYQWSQMKEDYYLYDPSLVNATNLTSTTNTLTATLGVRF